MLKVMMEDNSNDKVMDYLDEQGYDYKSSIDYIIEKITDYNKYPGLSLAYDSDYADNSTVKYVKDLAKHIFNNTARPMILKAGKDYEYDYSNIFDEAIDDSSEELEEGELEFQSLVSTQADDWEAERDYLDREYFRSR